MDVDLGGAGESSRRRIDISGIAEGTMEVVPLEMYDSARAKIDANLRWLFAKAYGIDHIPEDLRDPFYTDQYEQEHIKPPVIHLLLSGELYCRVCALVLKTDQAVALQCHQSVVHALSRKGIYVMESDKTPITEGDLAAVPVKMSAHMPMIDALMMAYTVEMISIEKVVAAIKRFSTFSASKELPYELEDAMVFWINKVNMKMREITEREHKVKQHPLESPGHQKVRYRREHASGRQLPVFPLLEDLMRDVSDGAALLAVVHYYCPEHMRLEDICLKEVPSIADSLYNIQLLKEFANEYLNKSFYLTTEDMLYSPLVLKHNVMVFIAELFWWFETVKPEFVQPRDLQEFKDARAMAHPKGVRPAVPISNATKRSFLVSPSESQGSPEVCNRYFLHPEDSEPLKGSPAFSPSHPLLPLRQRQQKQHEDATGVRNRSNSLTQMDGQPRASIIAWPEKRQRPVSSLSPYALHSADSDADVASGDSVSLARSISKDSLASNVIHVTPKHHALPQGMPTGQERGGGVGGGVPRRLNGHMLLANVSMEEDRGEAGVPEAPPPAPHAKQPDGSPGAALDGFFLEPLLPAVLRPPKERSVCPNKEEESGEGGPRASSSGRGPPHRSDTAVRRKAPLNQTFSPPPSPHEEDPGAPRPPGPTEEEQPPGGFYLHTEAPGTGATLEELGEERVEGFLNGKSPTWEGKGGEGEEGEGESAKLREDMSLKEHQDKDVDGGGSGRSSPSLSSAPSQASGCNNSGSVRMTSFAERRAHQQRCYGSSYDLRGGSSASSSQRTTPDGSESGAMPTVPPSGHAAPPWRLRRDQSPSSPLGVAGGGGGVLASELVQLHMQLEEKRRAIERQKKKMEVLSARQRQKLGKAAFLHVVKRAGVGRADTLPAPPKPGPAVAEDDAPPAVVAMDDLYVDALRGGAAGKEVEVGKEVEGERSFHLEEELDLNECNRSIELLNEAIGSIQQQMQQLSLQQELLMKHGTPPPASTPPATSPGGGDRTTRAAIHFVEPLSSGGAAAPIRRPPPRLSSARGGSSRSSKPSELKIPRGSRAPGGGPSPGGRSPRAEQPDPGHTARGGAAGTATATATFRLHDEANLRLPTRLDPTTLLAEEEMAAAVAAVAVTLGDGGEAASSWDGPGKGSAASSWSDEAQRSKNSLIEVDLSDLRDDEEGGGEDRGRDLNVTEGGDGEQKSGMGFFFKDEQKAEDELAKKRAAFLLKQQRKAEEARVRKQQLEAESELKRDDARRKAEEDRSRKEEEKTRRELIKQEYLRKKQQEMLEEQGLVKPKTPKIPKTPRPRHKHVPREEPAGDTTTLSKCSSAPDTLSNAQSGSSLSLASAATNEADSVHSGGAGSQRCDSVESFPGSRSASRTAERDWDNGSTASSIASMAEYTGPKLFKEPSAKSNKPIIHNAIAHCCLAGKVNEPQKNQILEELERCESNHLMILFRDGGCQFRALYSYFPDTEEIAKLTGTGPRSIVRKMIDKLYKYSSDRKQFTVIPAKTVSVSVDALTIHNHLWQAKRTATAASKKGPKL